MYHKDSCFMKTEKFCLKGFWVCAKLCMLKYWSVTLVMQSIHKLNHQLKACIPTAGSEVEQFKYFCVDLQALHMPMVLSCI